MDNEKRIVQYQTIKYGSIKVKLGELLNKRGITRNYLSTLTGIKYTTVDHYYKANRVERVDLDFLAKVCYVRDCDISDLLEYVPPEK